MSHFHFMGLKDAWEFSKLKDEQSLKLVPKNKKFKIYISVNKTDWFESVEFKIEALEYLFT